jgi:hypothetical protein
MVHLQEKLMTKWGDGVELEAVEGTEEKRKTFCQNYF